MTSLIDSQEAGKTIPALLWSSSSSHRALYYDSKRMTKATQE